MTSKHITMEEEFISKAPMILKSKTLILEITNKI
jgi:hypothetical protein